MKCITKDIMSTYGSLYVHFQRRRHWRRRWYWCRLRFASEGSKSFQKMPWNCPPHFLLASEEGGEGSSCWLYTWQGKLFNTAPLTKNVEESTKAICLFGFGWWSREWERGRRAGEGEKRCLLKVWEMGRGQQSTYVRPPPPLHINLSKTRQK